MKKGLVLEGGAMRGMFTAGVMDIFLENNIEFDGAIGVSAGAVFGCNYKSKQIGRVIRYNLKYCKDPNYSGIRSLIKTGDIYGVDMCYHEIPEKLDPFDEETYQNNPMEFYAVCTDVITGQPIYRQIYSGHGKDLKYLQASASMPLVSNMVEVDGRKLLDGGVSDSIPLKYFESIGYNKNVVVLTQPIDYVKDRNKTIPVLKRTMKDYPHIVNVMANRHNVYNETLEYIKQREKSKDALVIRPKHKLEVGHLEKNPKKLQEAYDHGREVGEEYLEKVLEFLK